MQFKTLYVFAVTLLSANMALGIATNAYAACNCPNNCGHSEGSSCKYKAGVSCTNGDISGHCYYLGNQLSCQA